MQGTKAFSRVRIMHASPDSEPLDIYIDDAPAAAHIAYGQLTDYALIAADRHHVTGFPAGTKGPQNMIINAHLVKLTPGHDYTVVAIGERQDLQARLMDDLTQAPNWERAKVRILHASPDAPAVDISAKGGPTLFNQVGFTDVTPFKEVDAGLISLEVRRTHHPDLIATLPEYTLTGGNLYTFAALGLLEGQPSFTIIPLVATFERCTPA